MNPCCPQPPDPRWFLPTFILGWMGICALLSVIGGWYELAQQYPATADIQGKKFRMASGAVGWPLLPVGYRSCLLATVGESGFRLGVFFLFRILHPTLFIPWSAVESVKQDRFFLLKRSTIRVHGFTRRLILYGGLGSAVFDGFNHVRATPAPS